MQQQQSVSSRPPVSEQADSALPVRGRAPEEAGAQASGKDKTFLRNIQKMHEGELEYEIRRLKEEEKRQQFIRDIQQQIDEKQHQHRGSAGGGKDEPRAGLSRGGSQATTAITNDPDNILQFKRNRSETEGHASHAQLPAEPRPRPSEERAAPVFKDEKQERKEQRRK